MVVNFYDRVSQFRLSMSLATRLYLLWIFFGNFEGKKKKKETVYKRYIQEYKH